MLRVGIIGLGVGEQHIAGYHSHPHCQVVALCDIDREKRQQAQAKYPRMKVTPEARELLEDPRLDIISIASYDNYHFEQAVQAIANDKHLFVEKPLCLYREQAHQLRLALERKKSIRLSSNLILRRSPRFRELQSMIAAGELGELNYIEAAYNYGRLWKITDGWRGRLDYYSITCGGGVHLIDLMLWLTGTTISEVFAYGNNIATRNSRFKYNDVVVAIAKFASGLTGKITSNFSCVLPHFHELVVYGTRATFVNAPDNARLYRSRDPAIAPEPISTAYHPEHKGALLYSFIEAILGRGQAEVTSEDVFRSMSVCFAVEQAMHTGQPVAVEYL